MLQLITEQPWILQIILSIFWGVVLWILYQIIDRAIVRSIQDTHREFMAKRLNRYFFTFIFIISLLFIWFQFARNILTFLGLFTAGLAVALKEVFANIAAWLFIIFTKPFSMGDRILINGQCGDVIDMRLFQFSLVEIADSEHGEQSTGKMVDIPNYYVFLYPVVNYVKGFPYVWNEITVKLSIDSNWQGAKEKFQTILEAHTNQFIQAAKEELENGQQMNTLFYTVLSPIVYLEVQNGAVVLFLRHICEPKQKRKVTQEIWQDILRHVQDSQDLTLL